MILIKSPPASHFIREAKLKVDQRTGRVVAGSITMLAEAIAKEKMKDLNAFDLKEATKIICGSARSMNEVKDMKKDQNDIKKATKNTED